MKKLLFLLPVMLLAVSMLHAADVRIATVNSFNGDIILVHNGVRSWVSLGAFVYEGDQICVRASGGGANDWIKLDDIVTPGICELKQSQVVGFPEGRWWNAKYQRYAIDNEGDHGNSAIIISQPEHYFMMPHQALRD